MQANGFYHPELFLIERSGEDVQTIKENQWQVNRTGLC